MWFQSEKDVQDVSRVSRTSKVTHLGNVIGCVKTLVSLIVSSPATRERPRLGCPLTVSCFGGNCGSFEVDISYSISRSLDIEKRDRMSKEQNDHCRITEKQIYEKQSAEQVRSTPNGPPTMRGKMSMDVCEVPPIPQGRVIKLPEWKAVERIMRNISNVVVKKQAASMKLSRHVVPLRTPTPQSLV